MKVDVQSQRVRQVHLDFDLSIEFDDGSTIALSEVDVDGKIFDEDNQFEGVRTLSRFVDAVCTGAEVDTAGTLTLTFDNASAVTASPRAEVESWEYTNPDGATILCLAGGEIEILDAFEVSRHSRRVGVPAVDATAVRISVGALGGVEFSDGTFVPMDLDLESAYLVLRESVVASVSTDVPRIKMSSGYVLGT